MSERVAIRVVALGIFALCVASTVFAAMPGTRVYRDSNRCAEQSFGSVFAFHHGERPSCDADYREVGTRLAGEPGLAFLLVPTALLAILVLARPRPLVVVIWSASTLLFGVVALLFTFQLDFDFLSTTREVELWPQRALIWSVGLIYLTQFLQLVVIGLSAQGQRRAAPEPRLEPLPRAIVRR